MITFKLDVEEIDRLARATPELSNLLADELKNAMEEAGLLLTTMVADRTPVNFGILSHTSDNSKSQIATTVVGQNCCRKVNCHFVKFVQVVNFSSVFNLSIVFSLSICLLLKMRKPVSILYFFNS